MAEKFGHYFFQTKLKSVGMKPAIQSIFKVFLLSVFFSCLISACNQKQKNKKEEEKTTTETTVEIPELLKREKVLGSKKEEDLYKKKFNDFSASAKKSPNNYKAFLGLAELYIAEARVTGEHPYYYPAALKMTNYVLDQKPENKDILFSALSLKASVLLSLHQFQKGKEIAQQAIEINPYNANIYGALVDANVELGNYEEAIQAADKMVSVRPDLRSYSRVSYLREIYGDVEGSIEAMDMAVKAGYPGYESTAWARYTLGKIYEDYGDLSNAEMHYSIVLQERPNYAFALNGLASVEMKKGNAEKAEKLVNESITIIPEVSFYENLAQIYKATKRTDKSVKTANTIIKMMAEDEASGHKMDLDKAKIYLHLLNNKDEALKLAMEEYKARPKNIDVNLLITEILIEQKEYTKAEEYLSVAAATNSKKPTLLLCKGVLASEKGEKEKAKQFFKQALTEDPYLTGEMAIEAKKSII